MAVTDSYGYASVPRHFYWNNGFLGTDRFSQFQNSPEKRSLLQQELKEIHRKRRSSELKEKAMVKIRKENSWPTSHEVVPQKGWKRRGSDQCQILSSFTKKRKLSCLEESMTQHKHPFPDEVTDLVQGPKKERPKKKIAQSQEMAMEMDIGFVQSALLRPFGGYSTFQEKLKVTSAGLTHHCSQYGVTLSIPEGAVEQPANVTFDACLYGVDFNFGEYVPVTPIVRVHVDIELKKPAELYLPHHVDDTDPVTRSKLTFLTADDSSKFFRPDSRKFVTEHGLCRISCQHFCSSCVALNMTEDKNVKKQYTMVRAEKKESHALLVHFCIYPRQPACKKLVKKQYSELDFVLKRFYHLILNDSQSVTASFDPDEIAGWKRTSDGDYEISEQNANYLEVMECKGKPVTEDSLQKLKMLEDELLYPPRFRFEFSCTNPSLAQSKAEVTATFTGQPGPLQIRIPLLTNEDEVTSIVPVTAGISPVNTFTFKCNKIFAKILSVVTSDTDLNKNWFAFGHALGLSIPQLKSIEDKTQEENHVREVLLLWDSQNETTTWEPVAEALEDICHQELAKKLESSFKDDGTMPTERNTKMKKLNIQDLGEVMKALYEVQFGASTWKELGLFLGLYHPKLEIIKEKDDKACLQKIIGLWLECQDGVNEKGGPTWLTLIQGIETTGNKAAAERLDKYIQLALMKNQTEYT